MPDKKKDESLPKVSKTIKDLPPSQNADAKIKGGAAAGETMGGTTGTENALPM